MMGFRGFGRLNQTEYERSKSGQHGEEGEGRHVAARGVIDPTRIDWGENTEGRFEGERDTFDGAVCLPSKKTSSDEDE